MITSSVKKFTDGTQRATHPDDEKTTKMSSSGKNSIASTLPSSKTGRNVLRNANFTLKLLNFTEIQSTKLCGNLQT